VRVRVIERVSVGVLELVAVRVGVRVEEAVRLAVAVRVPDKVAVGRAVKVPVGVVEGVIVRLLLGVGVAVGLLFVFESRWVCGSVILLECPLRLSSATEWGSVYERVKLWLFQYELRLWMV